MQFSTRNHLSDKEISDGYKFIHHIFLKIKFIFPEEYKNLNLEYIVQPKACGIYTLLSNNYLNYLKFKNNKKINFLFKLYLKFFFKYKKIKYFNSLNRNEISISKSKNLPNIYNSDEQNVFFVNMRSYLNVVTNYFKYSQNKNNILIITRDLFETELTKSIKLDKIIIFEEFIDQKILDELEISKKKFELSFLNNKKYLSDLFTIDGFNFFEYSYDGFKNIFLELLPDALLINLTFKKILKHINIKNVLTIRNRRIFDRTINYVSHLNKIKNYSLLHSNIGNSSNFINKMGNFNYIYGVLLWNSIQKDIIKKDKNSSVKKFYVTGSPLFDFPKNNYNYVNKNKIFIPASINNQSSILKLSNNLLKNDFIIDIKYHPNDFSNSFSKLKDSRYIKIYENKFNIIKLIQRCYLMITDVSESSILSIILGKPVLFYFNNSYNANLFNDIYHFNDHEKKLFCAHNYNDLLNILLKIKNNKNFYNQIKKIQEMYVKSYITNQDFKCITSTYNIDKILGNV